MSLSINQNNECEEKENKQQIIEDKQNKNRLIQQTNGIQKNNKKRGFLNLKQTDKDKLKSKEKEIYNILEHQLSVETFLKRKELFVIENELSLAKQVESLLQGYLDSLNNDSEFNIKSANSNYPELSNQLNNGKRYKPFTQSSTYKKSNNNKTLYIKREDGIFVKLMCTECGRENFNSNQGFINHCRILHNVDFPTHQEAALACGIPVDESEVPKDHICRRTFIKPLVNPLKAKIAFGCGSTLYKQVLNLKDKILGNKPKIKVYEEEVNLDDNLSDNESNTGSVVSSKDKAITNNLEQHNVRPSGKMLARQPLNSNLIIQKAEQQIESNEKELDKSSEETVEQNNDTIEADEKVEEQIDEQEPKTSFASKTQKIQTDIETKPLTYGEPLKVHLTPWTDPSISNKIKERIVNEKEKGTVSPNSKDGQDTSLSAKLGLDHESRFYIKKRIVVGNVSKYLKPENRNNESNYFKWMVYISGPSYDPDLSGFISKVRFYLHPSYKPDDIVDINTPPFHLTKYGWGEFPIRIQLHFHDVKNKPIDFIHHLKLDHQLTGIQQLGHERMLDIELDKNTKFKNGSSKDDIISNDSKQEIKNDNQNKLKWVPADFGLNKSLHNLLLYLLKDCPLITKKQLELPYTVAPSIEVYNQWTEGRRKASEYLRSQYLYEILKKEDIIMNNNENLILINRLSIKQIINWCRIYDHNIDTKVTIIPLEYRLANSAFCKACGVYQNVNQHFFCLSCKKLMQVPISSLSTYHQLLDKLPKGWDSLFDECNTSDIEDEEDLIIIDDEPINHNSLILNNNHKQFFDNLNQFKNWTIPNFINDKEIKFIIQVIKPLKLICFDNTNLDKQVPTMLSLALRIFLIKLLNSGLNAYNEQSNKKHIPLSIQDKIVTNLNESNNLIKNQPSRILTPLHIWKALMQNNNSEFDFLLNRFMGHQ